MSSGTNDDFSFSLRNLQGELNRVFDRVWQGAGGRQDPAVDLYEFADRFILLADVPGLSGDNVDVSYLDGMLTIRGEVPVPFPDEDGARSIRSERRIGAFNRNVEFPLSVDPDDISAKCRDGLLEVTLRKAQSASARSVRVTAD